MAANPTPPNPIGITRSASLEAALATEEPNYRLPLALIAIVAVGAALYFAEVVFIVIFVSLLLAFVLEPLTRLFERIRMPRAISSLLAVMVFMAALSAVAYFSYNKAISFAHDLPRYSGEISQITAKFRRQAQTIQKSTEQVIPETAEDKNTVKVKQQSSWTEKLFSSMGTATEIIFSASFVPFLAYFMLTWKEHSRRCSVMLFPLSMRSTAYATLTAIAEMVRGFIVGNFLVGLFIGAISTAIFGLMGLPYFYFVGFISGFLSLVPYLGVLLAAVPPLLTGVGHVHASGLLIVVLTVLGLHLFALNVLYPKFLGKRLQLNPLTVTVALLFWGWIWGAMGLILAIPMTAACKIVCDHIEGLRPLGAWLGE
jgi:predicted PurR-regulated permease PerM